MDDVWIINETNMDYAWKKKDPARIKYDIVKDYYKKSNGLCMNHAWAELGLCIKYEWMMHE